MTLTSGPLRITRDDIEAKLREVSGGLERQVEESKSPKVLAAAAGGALLVLLVVYLLGRRGGKKRSAVVEIRRL